MPTLRIVAEAVPPECTIAVKIEAAIDAAMGEILAALTAPLSAEEKTPRPKEPERLARKVFKGDLKEVNRFFYKRGWTDGFPIIPPTEDEVAEMMKGTDLPPDHVVGTLIPRLGKATIEKIAINAVMAGALPTYMPLLIAAVEILQPESGFGTYEVSTGSWIPFWIVNGQIRHDLHINSGQGALSPGDIANATIGRAISLIVKNIGGARKGIEDMGIFGNPGKYTMVLAENEEASPWEPLHVQNGLKKEDNAITVSFPNSIYHTSPFGSEAKGIVNGITVNARGFYLTVVIQPQHARTLGEEGWTKKQMAEYIAEYARMPAYKTSAFYSDWSPIRPRPPINAEDSVRIIPSPNSVRMVVAGGAGGLVIDLISGGGPWTTKKVTLPANWDKLVAKYKNIVPEYVKY